jgi:hypothetical protein
MKYSYFNLKDVNGVGKWASLVCAHQNGTVTIKMNKISYFETNDYYSTLFLSTDFP